MNKIGIIGDKGILASQESNGKLNTTAVVQGAADAQYPDNTPISPEYKGNIILGEDGVKYQVVKVDSAGHLQVDVLSGGGGGTQYADGAVRGTATGTIAMVDDGTNIQSMAGDAAGHPQIDIVTSALPTGASTSAKQDILLTELQLKADLTETQPVSLSTLPAGTNLIGTIKQSEFSYIPVNKNANYSVAQTDTVVWTPATNKSIVLLGCFLSSDAAMNIFIESVTTVIIPKTYVGVTGGAVISSGNPIWKGAANATLTITSSAAGNHSILLWGYEE